MGTCDAAYPTTQADRGKAALLQNGCNGCHGADLAGGRAPSLKSERFITAWENGGVGRLCTKIRDTMPPLNAEQVTPSTKVDIIAYLLQVNGFPLGTTELSVDPDTLESLQIVRKGKDSTRAPNFALAQGVGCLRHAPSRRWILTNSTD